MLLSIWNIKIEPSLSRSGVQIFQVLKLQNWLLSVMFVIALHAWLDTTFCSFSIFIFPPILFKSSTSLSALMLLNFAYNRFHFQRMYLQTLQFIHFNSETHDLKIPFNSPYPTLIIIPNCYEKYEIPFRSPANSSRIFYVL